MRRYYVRLRAAPTKPDLACFACGKRHADLALDLGKKRNLYVARSCLETIGATVSPIGEEALRSFAGTVLGNLASVALGQTFGPELQRFGGLLVGKQEPKVEPDGIIDAEFTVEKE